jgi:hypothetical protein
VDVVNGKEAFHGIGHASHSAGAGIAMSADVIKMALLFTGGRYGYNLAK